MDFQFSSKAKLNGKATVACTVESGSPPFQFEWLKNGSPLIKSSNYGIATGDDSSGLTLRKLTPEDTGNYTCIVKNQEGSDSHTAQLTMKCKQSYPGLI